MCAPLFLIRGVVQLSPNSSTIIKLHGFSGYVPPVFLSILEKGDPQMWLKNAMKQKLDITVIAFTST